MQLQKQSFISRAKEYLRMSDRQLATLYCYEIDSADVDKYEWQAFQDRKGMIRDLLTFENAG